MLPFRKRGQLNLAVKAGRFIAVQIVYLRDDQFFLALAIRTNNINSEGDAKVYKRCY